MSERLILLVEDNEVNRDMLVRRLERAGHRVSTAGDGEAALQNMRALQPAVVLMDMNLPVKDGWSACEEAARDASIKHIPIIALTAHAMAKTDTVRWKPGAVTMPPNRLTSPSYSKKIATCLNASR